MWIIINCLKYPDTRWLIGRARYNILSKTTLLTFLNLINEFKLEKLGKYNNSNHIFTFINKSKVFFQDLYYYPSDPDMNALRGYELTGMALDEGAEIPYKAYEILFNTRLRYNLDKYNLIPKVLVCSNPSRNWLYNKYYIPWRDGTLPSNVKYIQSTCDDNPFLSKAYIDGLKNSTELMKQIYYYGNWEYDEDLLSLFNHERLMNCFYNPIVSTNNSKYITCDVAMAGKDKTCITYWEGLNCMEIELFDIMDTITNVEAIKAMIEKHNVNISNVIIDRTGVGNGVCDLLKGCVGFEGSHKPLKGESFQNQKAQLYYKLSDMVYYKNIFINQKKYMDDICKELEAHQKYKIENEGKTSVTPKDKIKQSIGRSPDIADSLMMRMYFEYKSNRVSFKVL